MSAKRWAALAAMTALAAALAPLPKLPAARAADMEDMFLLTTDHYRVRTDISPQFAALVGKHMEAIFQQYSAQFRDYGQMMDKFNVVVFGRRADYNRLVAGRAEGSAGVFMSDLQLLAANAEGRTTEAVLRTLYHEGFHQFMFVMVSPDAPMWANEGIAEYFSNATWNGQTFTLGEVPTVNLYVIQQAVKDGRYIPFRSLFRLGRVEWNRRSQADRRVASMQYAESWSIVHFLIHADGGRYAPMLNRLLKSISQGQLSSSAMEDVFGRNYNQFEDRWARYVMALKPSAKFTCRDNMMSLLLLAKLVYRDPRSMRGVEQFRHDLLYQTRSGWILTTPTGDVLTSSETDRVTALFRCPLDQSGAESSYMLIRNLDTGLPTLVCTHHPGVVELAYYERDRSGDLSPTVEEQVWETLTPDLQRAIRTASR